MDTKICLAIVSNRGIKAKTTQSLLSMVAFHNYEIFPVVATEGYTIAENRNYCIFQAMKNDCSHILFIDDDMTFPPHILHRLLSHKKHIIGVDSKSRTFPLTTTVSLMKNGKHWPHKEVPDHYQMPNELFEVYGIGLGVALIDMDVFNFIEKPWFAFKADENGQVIMGEDQWFCEQAKKKGYTIYCDPIPTIGHIGDWEFSEDNQPKLRSEKIIYESAI